MSYKVSSASHIALAYALNSRKENTDVYFVKTTLPNNTILNNNDLGLTRSHHFSFTFAQQPQHLLHRQISREQGCSEELWH